MQARSGWWRTPCTPSPARNSESTSEGSVAALLAPVHESVARLTTIPGVSHRLLRKDSGLGDAPGRRVVGRRANAHIVPVHSIGRRNITNSHWSARGTDAATKMAGAPEPGGPGGAVATLAPGRIPARDRPRPRSSPQGGAPDPGGDRGLLPSERGDTSDKTFPSPSANRAAIVPISLLPPTAAPRPPIPPLARAAVVVGVASVIDGDTIEIHGQRIRGIDAPETSQPCDLDGKPWRCGQASANALAEYIGRRTVTCEYYANTLIDSARGERWFCSEAEAEGAGWRRAQQ